MDTFSKTLIVLIAFIQVMVACYYKDIGDTLGALFYIGLGCFMLLLIQVEKK